MSEPITWTNERRKLSDLVPWERNPRQIRQDEAQRLEDSLERFGQIQTIAIGPDNEVYDGHQRKLVWAASQKFGPDYEVDVRVSSRALTERERQQLVVYLHRGTVGEWDFDILSIFDTPDLLDWGFKPFELGIVEDVDYEELWKGMPEFENNPKAMRSLAVHFETQYDLADFAELIEQEITDKTRSIWYPAKQKQDNESMRYSDES